MQTALKLSESPESATVRARTPLRRNILIAVCAVGFAVVVGLVAQRRDAARALSAEREAKLVTVQQQQRMPEGALEDSIGVAAVPARHDCSQRVPA